MEVVGVEMVLMVLGTDRRGRPVASPPQAPNDRFDGRSPSRGVCVETCRPQPAFLTS